MLLCPLWHNLKALHARICPKKKTQHVCVSDESTEVTYALVILKKAAEDGE